MFLPGTGGDRAFWLPVAQRLSADAKTLLPNWPGAGRALGGQDWRPDYRREFPDAAAWVLQPPRDLTDEIRQLTQPTLLIWGDSDPVSPVAVGEHLAQLLPAAELHVLAGGTHSLAHDHPRPVADLIAAHLG